MVNQKSGFPIGSAGKESVCLQCRRYWRCRFDPWVRKILWKGKWQTIPVFLPEKFHGQRSLAGYSPKDGKESEVTKHAQSVINYINES